MTLRAPQRTGTRFEWVSGFKPISNTTALRQPYLIAEVIVKAITARAIRH
jgi:hypothetical protein